MKIAARRLLAGTVVVTLAAGCSDSSPVEPIREAPPAGNTPPAGSPAPTAPVAAGAFSIDIRYIGDAATPRQRQAVETAVAQWRAVITGDLPSIPARASADACFAGQPALDEVIDDLLIFVEFKEIDGPGKILGQAGPCFVRTESMLPVVGHLQLDVADLQRMEQLGTLDAVVTHEIGHIAGIGTLWGMKNVLTGAGSADPRFTGMGAIAAYHVLGGADAAVPVEGTGEAGTRDGHWRESVFGNELMTGFLSAGANPMSAMTIASLRDLGYNTNLAAAATYSLATAGSSYASVDIHAGERLVMPRFLINRNGEVSPITGQVSTTPWRTNTP